MEKDRLDSFSETSSVGSDESLQSISGPDFAEFANKLSLQRYRVFIPTEDLSRENTIDFPSTITQKETLPKTTDLTTLFLVDSVNRDKAAFPQPTSFSLRLPRVYKNVKSIQLTDVKLLCSFYYFSAIKSNIYLPISERGRDITTLQNFPISKLISIREGTYNINDLLSEIQTQLNYTPLFYDFPNGFTDFANIFSVSGDYSLNFNQPGDTYFDSLNSKYINNPTITTIVSYYWGSRYAGLSSYTIDQLKVAYYYPVLYELLLDSNDKTALPFLNLEGPIGSDGLPPSSHIIFNMSGINDPIALLMINNNISFLDTYRLNHTFRYSLVNRYQVAYDANSLRVNITTLTLNTSLINLINNTLTSATAGVFNSLGLTAASFSSYESQLSRGTVIYADMYNFLQSQLATILGIPYGTYPASFFATNSNIIYFQDGANALGIPSKFSVDYLNSISGKVSLDNTSSNSPGYWPNIIPSNGYITTGITNINPQESLVPFSVDSKNFLFGSSAIDPTTHYLNTSVSSRSLDILVNISSTQYTILKFKSPVRQTLQVETLPLPYYYRYSEFNKQGLFKGVLDLSRNNVPQELFDISYSYVDYYNIDITNYSPIILRPTFGYDFINSFSRSPVLNINTLKTSYYFQFTAPRPSGVQNLIANNTSFSIVSVNTSNISTNFTDLFTMFLYHDRAAFMADLGIPRSENPLHYIGVASTTTSKSDVTINFSTFSGDKYYAIFRSNNITCSNNTILPVIYYNDSNYTTITTDYTNFDPYASPFNLSNVSSYAYVTNYNTDFSRLPVTSTLDSITPDNSFFKTLLTIKRPPIGYDISGVSSDLTDYIGINSSKIDPTQSIRYDPLNNYSFQLLTPFDTISTSYFGPTSSNVILTPLVNVPYTLKNISSSQLKVVHWYEGYSIPRQLNDNFTSFSNLGIATASTINSAVSSFKVDQNNNIVLGRGVNAIGFLPTDGTFNTESFAFKSRIYPLTGAESSSNDPNLQIAYIGVFSGLSLLDRSLTMSSALTLLKFNKSTPYGPNTTFTQFSYGTWYNFVKDSNFLNTSINGYSPGSNELLSYNSMYYMVPFDSQGNITTYSILSGSLLPYPLEQQISTGMQYLNNQTVTTPPGTPAQASYIIPVSNNISSQNIYGPQGIYSQTQSQYEQSLPITTPSIGYREKELLVDGNSGLYNFNVSVYNNSDNLNLNGQTTYFTEYSNNLFIVNTISNTCSNAGISFPTASYASSLTSIISMNNGNSSSIYYTLNPAAPVQNYTVNGIITIPNIYNFTTMPGDTTNITVKSLTILPSMRVLTIWMWGGGGGTTSSNYTGGAGAYVKIEVNISTLLKTITPDSPNGISTLYLVIGKGGNRDNFAPLTTLGSLQNLEQLRYGGGGTSLSNTNTNVNNILPQGGGFSGIFAGSNILTATPLLIVGGGGAAGTGNGTDTPTGPEEYGGPGGFGLVPIPFSTINYPFSAVTFNTVFYSTLQLSSVTDKFNSPVLNNTSISSIIDKNLLTLWDPVLPAPLNPLNYYPTVNTYGITLNFLNSITVLSKIRYYGPSESNILNLPTGFIVYNNETKSQILFSNTNIKPSDFQLLNNGSFNQNIYDIFLTTLPSRATINSNIWLIAGINNESQNSIQYSLDLINWIPTANTIVSSVIAIVYNPTYSAWFAIGPTSIISSIDGINWSVVYSDSGGPNFTTLAFGTVNATNLFLAGADDGSIYIYRNGEEWISIGQVFPEAVTKIRMLNGKAWAFAGSYLKSSSDGIGWASIVNFTLASISDIAYGLGNYIIAQTPNDAPLISAIIFSPDGITWSNSALTNTLSFTPTSIIFGNNRFVAVGSTNDGTSFIKYSNNGINWFNSTFPSRGDIRRTDVAFFENRFVSVGQSAIGPAANQVSVITSPDGINWSYSLSGGFDSQIGAFSGKSAAYGPVSITQDPRTIYLEIQKATFNSSISESLQEPIVYELQAYGSSQAITGNISYLIDDELSSIFYPPEIQTVGVVTYNFVFSFSNLVPYLNYIQIYTPAIDSAQFTGITISLDNTSSSIIYTSSNVSYQTSGSNYVYNLVLMPELKDVSNLYITFTKISRDSIQISYIRGIYDPNLASTQKLIASVEDTNSRITSTNNTVSNIIDNNFTTYWAPLTFIQGETLDFTVNFTVQADSINFIRVVNGTYTVDSPNLISGIGIYSDYASLSNPLYYNTNITSTRYLTYSVFYINIPPIFGYNSLFIRLYKNSPGIPIINDIQFFNIGDSIDRTTGFTGGSLRLMRRSILPPLTNDGGGGSRSSGGNAGILAKPGMYLMGGSPALPNTGNSSGGGGGGYYGGGGGGAPVSGIGAAGGGGSGYIYTGQPIFTVVDYGIASPGTTSNITNYITPGLEEQNALVISNIITSNLVNYGQGGNMAVDSGKGGHGLIVAQYQQFSSAEPTSSLTAEPSFIDGSKLTLLQAPVIDNTDVRNLAFTTYTDSIQLSQYSGYNWIWYNSYLSMVGNRLTSSMQLSTLVTVNPPAFPSLPTPIFSSLTSQFTNISSFFSGATSNANLIATSIDATFSNFQNTYFINTQYTDASYVEMTEIYCLLDYLRNLTNLVNPHVNPSNPTLDRIFGGIPRFGYWANPFLTNASYVGFDVTDSLIPTPSLSTLARNGNPVQAMYGLILEQSLSTGTYEFKDIMAYKPSLQNSIDNGINWLKVTQFNDAYAVRSLTNTTYLDSNVIVQPYTFKNAISARLPLFNYSVYTVPTTINLNTYNIPVQVINDFEGSAINLYSFYNTILSDISSINYSKVPFTSTTITMNQTSVTNSSRSAVLGTLVSEYQSTVVNVITSFQLDSNSHRPILQYTTGSNNYYNTFVNNSGILSGEVGKAFSDYLGNYFVTGQNDTRLFENTSPAIISPKALTQADVRYASPKYILSEYLNNSITPYSDFLFSKYTNIWHIPAYGTQTSFYGIRLNSSYDLNSYILFANQIFYPTHKIVLEKIASPSNPITKIKDLANYPSYPHTEMFFYKNFSSLVKDIDGKYAKENTSNFVYSDKFSGYGFNSYIYNVNLQKSDTSSNPDSFNYLAIRAYSPSETFQSLVRFYLPNRYDFGYITLNDLSNELITISSLTNVNPDYRRLLQRFNATFSTNRVYGSVGIPGFTGSNISTTGFGNFLNIMNQLNLINSSNTAIISTVSGQSNAALTNLITGDLQYILPSYLASRNRVTDPVEFSIPFSSCVNPLNAKKEQYGIGYNLGFALEDTDHNTVQRASSFFKILDDYIYLQMNQEINMNTMGISQQENFSQTRDSTAQSGIYNAKLILNNFGSFATTFVHSPVTFNPLVGKIDKLTFSWYDSTGTIINNADCEWSGSVQIVESVNTA